MNNLFLHQPEDAIKASGVLSKLWRLYTIGFVSEKMYADLMNRYLEEYYPDPQKRENKRTNLPRAIIEGDDMTWDVFMEAITILRLSKCKFSVELHDNQGFFRTYTLDLLSPEPNGDDGEIGRIKRPKGSLGQIITSFDEVKACRGWLAWLTRFILMDANVTWKRLDKAIDAYLDVPGNLEEGKSRTTTKGNNRDRILKAKVGWDGFLKAMDILEYRSIRVTLDTTWGVSDRVKDVHYTFPKRDTQQTVYNLKEYLPENQND